MKKLLLKLALCVASVGIFAAVVLGQGGSTGNLAGTITDPKGAVVAGATVVVKNAATNQEFTTQTNSEGYFRVPSLTAGIYTATVTAQGFKLTNVTDIKIDVGLTSTINVALEVGGSNETVNIVGGGELIRTENATVGTTLTGRQITDIPTASRDALDLVLALPGTATPGRPRTSSVNGLPKGALNITLDGINVQDNLLKSSDGFFTYIRPRTDAISEVTVSTSNPGAESSSEGAVQIKFVTQGGGNEYHGEGYWYHRNPALNANYWFNNRDLRPLPGQTDAPHSVIILNQFGGKFGGPISIPGLFSGKDKAFFFVNYEEFRLPERTLRTRTILHPLAQSGIHRFLTSNSTFGNAPPANVTCAPSGSQFLCSANVFAMAQAGGLISTPDPTISALLGQIRSSVSGLEIRDTGASTPNLQQVSFVNPGGQKRYFPTVRFDFNVTKNHHIENIWNYQLFTSQVDFLNGVDPAFPGFPNFGSQDSNRFSNTTAWRWTITNSLVNEARFGLVGGTVLFFPQVNAGQFQNQGGVNLGIGAAGISGATVVNTSQRRNTPVKQFNDTVNWVKGNHSFNFGVNATRVNFFQQIVTAVPTVNFGISSTLPGDATAWNAFSSLQPVAQQAGAAALYATLAGRISSIGGNARLSEETNRYTYLGDLISRAQQTEYGVFGQDTWRIRPNVTLNFGLRWEVQTPFIPLNNTYSQTTYAELFGESGVGNLFRPGVLQGTQSRYTLYTQGTKAYSTKYDSFAPSVGFSYSPNFQNGFMRRILGESGRTVFRGGFSMAFVREGINTFQSIFGANPGGFIDATQNITGTPFPLSFGNYFRNGLPARPAIPASPNYPNVGGCLNQATGCITDSVNAFLPDLDIGYVESWTFGVQRELSSNMAIEVRYVGNRGHKLWRQYNLNEVNVFENGFLQEFILAQQNLLANIAQGRGFNFRYFGPGTGTSPLPIILGHFAGLPASQAGNQANYGSSLFANTTFLGQLNPLNPAPATFAATLASTANESLFANNRIAAGIPYNFFVVNPGKRGGAFLIDNGSQTYYDAVTVEFRRRLTRGLLVQSSYTFSKALGNTYASSSIAFDQPASLRFPNLRRGVAPFDITHGFKTNFIYELPIGKGKAFFGNASNWVDKIIGDWGMNGNIRIQSGTPFTFGNVALIGMTKKDLQDLVGIYREADGFVYFLPTEIRTNTFRAFNTNMTATGPVYTQGTPSGRYIAPAAAGNCMQGFTGGCGFANLVLKGPAFFRFDLSLVKKIKFTERVNLELRGEFLNAFNNINFLVGSPAADVNAIGGFNTTSFARITSAYQDLSTTNDPGGRLVQLVVRLRF
jgi:hypothetical protein